MKDLLARKENEICRLSDENIALRGKSTGAGDSISQLKAVNAKSEAAVLTLREELSRSGELINALTEKLRLNTSKESADRAYVDGLQLQIKSVQD